MTRPDTTTPYAEMVGNPAAYYAGQGISKPTAGYFRHKIRGGSVAVGVRIHFGPPLDPITGEELDRSWRWMADVNGEYFDDFDRCWPGCTGEPITDQEYRRFCTRQEWARKAAPDSSYAQPGRRYDPLSTSTPLPF